jgi:hypothetical protein
MAEQHRKETKMGKRKKVGTEQVVLGVEDYENPTKARALWKRSVEVRRYEGNAETGRLVEDYRATLFGMDAPQNEVELWQHTGAGLELLAVLPLDWWHWSDDAELMEWISAAYQRSITRYDRTMRKIHKVARAAYTYQNEEPAPF